MSPQAEDDQTKPHNFTGTLASPADASEPAVALDKRDDPIKDTAINTPAREEAPSRSERDRREAARFEPATSAYEPVAAPTAYGSMGAQAGGGYPGPGGYGGPGGYQSPSVQQAPPQVAPVSRNPGAARRARLKVSHLGPLSVLRVSLTFSLCMFIVLLVAVAALWGVLDSSGVFKSIISAATTLTNDGKQAGIAPWLTFGRVMLIAVVLGAANVIAFTLLSMIGALLYNLCSDFVGGVEVTLIER